MKILKGEKNMCPFSGMVQFLIVVVTLLLVCHSVIVHSLRVTFQPKNYTLKMYESATVNFSITGEDYADGLLIYTQNPHIAEIDHGYVIENPQIPFHGAFNLTGKFLGKTEVFCKNARTNTNIPGNMNVTVIREKRVIDNVFTGSVITLVSIIYINFGCALNWGNMIQTLRKPIGPVIGFCGQFILMPLLSFGLGKWLFPYNTAMQLGMFFTGVSPAGGASNIWTLVLDGNIDLSVTMTTISTFAAFGMMPLWLFTLGQLLFDENNIKVPYVRISELAAALVVPLAIGYLISRYFKKVSQFLVRILKGFSTVLLLFIIIFATVTNLYLFELFSWEIVVAGMALPYLGYVVAFAVAKLLKQPPGDCLAIGIETGIQNTGIAIFMLRALPQPQADLTTVIPVSVAMMTPLPLLAFYVYKKVRSRIQQNNVKLTGIKDERSGLALDKNYNKENEDRLISTISA